MLLLFTFIMAVVAVTAQATTEESNTESNYIIPLKYNGWQYTSPIRIGRKNYDVEFSFGSSSIWVYSNSPDLGLPEDETFVNELYDIKDGNILSRNEDIAFVEEHVDGLGYMGLEALEKVEIAGVEIQRLIGVVNDVSGADEDTPWYSKRQGVVGLAPRIPENDSNAAGKEKATDNSPLGHILKTMEQVDRFSLVLGKDTPTGEIRFGNSNDEAHYHGPITYVPVIGTSESWDVPLDSFRLGKTELTTDDEQNKKVNRIEINLASNVIWAPQHIIDSIVDLTEQVSGQWGDDDEETYVTIDCDERRVLPNLVFEFGGVPFEFEPHEYFPEFEVPGKVLAEKDAKICMLFMKPSEALPEPLVEEPDGWVIDAPWCLGVPFFKKFYSVYEKLDEDRYWKCPECPQPQPYSWQVGFALAK